MEPVTQPLVPDHKDSLTKKVLRQTTLPIVPTRLQTFQRQLSHRLEVQDEIKFSVCKLPQRSNSNHLGIFKPELYKEEALRRASVASTIVEMVPAGLLLFSVRYDYEVEGLVVKVREGRDLPIKDVWGTCDPYVKIYLLPERRKKYISKVKRKNLNPVFNQTFIFNVAYTELQHRQLQFSLYDFDRFSRHDLIGHVVLKNITGGTDLSREMEYTMEILSPPEDKVRIGELMISLCYLPIAGRLTITVVKARKLKAMDITGKSDPFVKVTLMCRGKRIKKKKTTIRKSTLDPIFNEALVFDVPPSNIEEVSLLIKVIDYDRFGADELIGCTAVGTIFEGVGKEHWLEMIEKPRIPAAQWYPLVDSVPGYIPTPEEEYKFFGSLRSFNCFQAKPVRSISIADKI